MKSVDYLKKLKVKENLSSNKLGELLNMTHSSMSKLLQEKTTMSDYTASQVAEILGINKMEIIAQCNLERAKKESEKNYWIQTLKKLAACVTVTVMMVSGGYKADFQALEGQKNAKTMQTSAFVLVFLYYLMYV